MCCAQPKDVWAKRIGLEWSQLLYFLPLGLDAGGSVSKTMLYVKVDGSNVVDGNDVAGSTLKQDIGLFCDYQGIF